MKKIVKLSESDLVKLVKKVIKEQMSNHEMNEISSDTFKSALNVSKSRGTDRRTYKLGELYLNKFLGRELLGGEITDIGVNMPQQGNYSEVSITVTKTEYPESGYFAGKENKFNKYIHYDIDNDEYVSNGGLDNITRKDAFILSKIAQLINPNTKYKQTGMHFNIKGW